MAECHRYPLRVQQSKLEKERTPISWQVDRFGEAAVESKSEKLKLQYALEQNSLRATAKTVKSLAKGATRMLLAHFIGDAGWKRLEANVITSPAWMLECCAFAAATGAARAVRSLSLEAPGPPQDDGHSAGERRMMLTALAPKPDPRRCSL
jgi:hypothetical protein